MELKLSVKKIIYDNQMTINSYQSNKKNEYKKANYDQMKLNIDVILKENVEYIKELSNLQTEIAYQKNTIQKYEATIDRLEQ